MKLQKGEINTKELVDIFGTDKQKENYSKNKKLNSGNKKSIIKKASRFCEIEDLGKGKFIIHKVFNLTINDEMVFPLLKGLSQYMTPLILTKLLNEQDENYKVTLSFISWAKRFEIVNSNYSFMRNYQRKSSKHLDINEDTLFDYFDKMDSCIRYFLEKILKILNNKSGLDLIEFDLVTKVKKMSRIQTIKDVDILFECDKYDEEISDKDRKFVIDCENKAKIVAGITDNREKFYGLRSKVYKKTLSQLLIERNILFTYQAYNIFCKDKKGIENLLSKFESIIDYKDKLFIKNVNNIFIDYIEDKARKTNKREQNKYDKLLKAIDRKKINYVKKFRIEDAYVDNFKLLSELTIPKNINRKLEDEIIITSEEKYGIKVFDKNN